MGIPLKFAYEVLNTHANTTYKRKNVHKACPRHANTADKNAYKVPHKHAKTTYKCIQSVPHAYEYHMNL